MTGVQAPSRDRRLFGIGCMVVGMLGMGGVDAAGKWLVGADYHVLQVLAVRGWFIVAAFLLWAMATGRLAQLPTRRPGGHFIRLLLAFPGPALMFTALIYMPLADVTVIVFGSTFMTAALSVPLFKEHIGIHRWFAIFMGFAGVVIALRPGAGVFEPAAILALLAGLSFATINLTARWLRETESTLRLVFYVMLGMMLIGSAALPWVWSPMPPEHMAVFAAMGVFTLIGYAGMTQAFVVAPVGAVAPFEYTVLLWAVILGFIIWGDVPDAFVWTGAALIVGSGLYMVHREARAEALAKQRRTGAV